MLTIQKPTTPILIEDLGMLYPTATSKRPAQYGLYRCQCGNEWKTQSAHIKSGVTQSCGCYQKQRLTTHGLTKHPLFGIWRHMRDRTTKPNNKAFKNYGGRGISVCDEWENDFKKFYDDMVGTYQEGLSIDRINNDKGYSLENCRWTTCEVQARNTRRICSTNTSGYRGVHWNKQNRKWVAGIKTNGERKHLGSFPTALDGAVAYDRFVIENNLEHTRNGVI